LPLWGKSCLERVCFKVAPKRVEWAVAWKQRELTENKISASKYGEARTLPGCRGGEKSSMVFVCLSFTLSAHLTV